MRFFGVVDSPASIVSDSKICATCSSAAYVGDRLCLKCLFEGALEPATRDAAIPSFKSMLAQLNTHASQWRVRDYEILEEIGRGGMGVIYRARELHSKRIVALKRVLNYHADSEQTLARFRREAETATKLDHPNIVPVYYVSEDEEALPFFSMKFAAGGSLLQSRQAFGNDPRGAVSLISKVAVAIHYAHGQGVLHRDLKPSNILLDHRLEPMVSDFGLAKWLDTSADLTRTLTIFGTPGYIAPEQAAGDVHSLTAAADVYSLGAILFELLSGRPPFLGEHALAVIRQATEQPAPRLRSVIPNVDRDLETICAHALETRASARYQSADNLARDLQHWLTGRPIVVRPIGIGTRLWRSCRRTTVVSAVVMSLLLLSALISLWRGEQVRLTSSMQSRLSTEPPVAALPIFDLDEVRFDGPITQSLVNILHSELNWSSPIRVLQPEELRNAAVSNRPTVLLTGTRRKIRDKIRFSVRALNTVTSAPLLAYQWEDGPFDVSVRRFGERLGRQMNALRADAELGKITLAGPADPGEQDEQARELIVAGRNLIAHYNASDLDRAVALLQKAVKLQPESAVAHAQLAIAATTRTHYLSDPVFLQIGEEEARKAFRLSPDSSDAHRALGGVYYQTGEFQAALEEGLRTIEIGGLEEKTVRFVALTLDTIGQLDQAARWYVIAHKLAKTPGEIDALIGDCWIKLCGDERAIGLYRRATELRPESSRGQVGLCHLYLFKGDFARAREIYQTSGWIDRDLGDMEQIAAQTEFFARDFATAAKVYDRLMQRDPDGGRSFYSAIDYRSALARTKQAVGDSRSAQILLDHCLASQTRAVAARPNDPEANYCLAAVESCLGRLDASLQYLRAAARLGWTDYRAAQLDPRFDAVRESQGFKDILASMSVKIAAMRSKVAYLEPVEE